MNENEKKEVLQMFCNAYKNKDKELMNVIRKWHSGIFIKENTWCAKKWNGPNGESDEIVFFFTGDYGPDITFGFTAVDKEWNRISIEPSTDMSYRQLEPREVIKLIINEAKKRGIMNNLVKGFAYFDDEKNTVTFKDEFGETLIFNNGEWPEPVNKIKVDMDELKHAMAASNAINSMADYYGRVECDIKFALSQNQKENKPFSWYEHPCGSVIYFISNTSGFGFCVKGHWLNLSHGFVPITAKDEWKPAKSGRVLALLLNEAERRGFHQGALYNPLNEGFFKSTVKINGSLKAGTNQDLMMCALYHKNSYIMLNGEWATAFKHPAKRFYKNQHGQLAFFNTETTGWGFLFNLKWCRFKNQNLNGADETWEPAKESEVRNELLRHALIEYPHGTKIESANGNKIGYIKYIQSSKKGFEIYSDGVRLYDYTTGKWATKL